MTSSLQSRQSLMASDQSELTPGTQEVSIYTKTDNNSGLIATSYVKPLPDLIPRKQRWEIRRPLGVTGGENSDWLSQFGKSVDDDVWTGPMLSFRTDGMSVTDGDVTNAGASLISSAFALAILAVGEQYPRNVTLLEQLEEWRGDCIRGARMAEWSDPEAQVVGEIARRHRDYLLGKTDLDSDDSLMTPSVIASWRIFINQSWRALIGERASVSRDIVFLDKVDLSIARQQTSLITAIGVNKVDLEAVDLWKFYAWTKLLGMLLSVLREEVVEIVKSERATRVNGSRTHVRYEVKLKGFPEGYTTPAWPDNFPRGSKLVEAFHNDHPEMPKPDDQHFAP